MQGAFNNDPGHRTEAEWRKLLGGLLESLCAFTGIQFTATSWFIEDQAGHASAGGSVDVRGTVSEVLRLEVCGALSVSVNFREAAWVSSDLLLFSDGERVAGPYGLDLVLLVCTPEGWSSKGWIDDEHGEWENCQTDARWRGNREDRIIICREAPEGGSGPGEERRRE